jgi:hypothetical protein
MKPYVFYKAARLEMPKADPEDKAKGLRVSSLSLDHRAFLGFHSAEALRYLSLNVKGIFMERRTKVPLPGPAGRVEVQDTPGFYSEAKKSTMRVKKPFTSPERASSENLFHCIHPELRKWKEYKAAEKRKTEAFSEVLSHAFGFFPHYPLNIMGPERGDEGPVPQTEAREGHRGDRQAGEEGEARPGRVLDVLVRRFGGRREGQARGR